MEMFDSSSGSNGTTLLRFELAFREVAISIFISLTNTRNVIFAGSWLPYNTPHNSRIPPPNHRTVNNTLFLLFNCNDLDPTSFLILGL